MSLESGRRSRLVSPERRREHEALCETCAEVSRLVAAGRADEAIALARRAAVAAGLVPEEPAR